MTIEVDKQNKIQQNLNTLDKYVKKGIKTNTLPKPKSIKMKSQTRKPKRSNG